MTQMLLSLQNAEMWNKRKEEGKQVYFKEMTSLLKKRKMKEKREPESRIDLFKKMVFKIKDDAKNRSLLDLEGLNIWDTILKCSPNGLNRVYDVLYAAYLDNSISPDIWTAFENLITEKYYL